MEYSSVVLDHWKHPQNMKDLDHPTVRVRDWNPLCGDIVEIQLEIQDDTIVDASFKGEGCAICTASASQLTEMIEGKHITVAENISVDDHLASLDLQKINPARLKCATLALHVLKLAVKSYRHAGGRAG